ncbi:MAG: peptidylprolyl isomerase [Planctomycetes bacterium]|nr:peptidylprolyl isomerase [Planctomycetota bacterium]
MMNVRKSGSKISLFFFIGVILLLVYSSTAKLEETEENLDPRRQTAIQDWVADVTHPELGHFVISEADFHRHLLRNYGVYYRSSVVTPRMLIPEIINKLPLSLLKVELDVLVNAELLRRAMRNAPVNPELTEEVDERIEDDRKRVEENYKGQFTLEEILERQDDTLESYREKLTATLWLEDIAKSQVNPRALTDFYNRYKDYYLGKQVYAAQIYIRAIDRSKFLEELRDWEKTHTMTPEQRTRWWEQRVTRAWREAQERMEKAIQDARRLDFAQAATLHSDDAATASGGGVIGYIRPKGQFDDRILLEAFNTAEGKMSNVVRTESGFHVLYIYQKYDPGVNVDFEQIAEYVRQDFKAEKQKEHLDKLRDESEIIVKIGQVTLPPGVPPE